MKIMMSGGGGNRSHFLRPDLPKELAILATALARPGDVTRSCLRVEKAENGLGWSPKNDVREGIRHTLSGGQELRVMHILRAE